MTDTVETDLTYAISEIQDIQAELDLFNLSDMAQRLEGAEARFKEVIEALIEFSEFAPSNPYSAATTLRDRLTPQV